MVTSATAVFGTLNTGVGSSPNVALGSVSAGVTLVVVGYWHDPSGTTYTPSCADTVNGTYGTKILDIYDSTNQQRMVAFRFLGSASGSPTATVTLATSEYAAAMGFIVSGSDGTTPTVIGQAQTATTATDNLTSTTLTPTSQPGLLLGLAAITGTLGTGPSPGTGFASLGTGWVDGSALARAESKAFSSTSAIAATFTAGTATQHHAIALAFYDAAGGGGGGSAPAVIVSPRVFLFLPSFAPFYGRQQFYPSATPAAPATPPLVVYGSKLWSIYDKTAFPSLYGRQEFYRSSTPAAVPPPPPVIYGARLYTPYQPPFTPFFSPYAITPGWSLAATSTVIPAATRSAERAGVETLVPVVALSGSLSGGRSGAPMLIVTSAPAGSKSAERSGVTAGVPTPQPVAARSTEHAGATSMVPVVIDIGSKSSERSGAVTPTPTAQPSGAVSRQSAGAITMSAVATLAGSRSCERAGATSTVAALSPAASRSESRSGFGILTQTTVIFPAGVRSSERGGATTFGGISLNPVGTRTGERSGAAQPTPNPAPVGASARAPSGAANITPATLPSAARSCERSGAETFSMSLLPAGTKTGERSGAAITASSVVTVAPAASKSGEHAGSATLAAAVAPAGAASGQHAGAPNTLAALQPKGARSFERSGTELLVATVVLFPAGSASGARSGAGSFAGIALLPAGTRSGAASGTPSASPVSLPAGARAGQRAGFAGFALVTNPAGARSSSPAGASALTTSVSPNGARSEEAHGPVQVSLFVAVRSYGSRSEARSGGGSSFSIALSPAGAVSRERSGFSGFLFPNITYSVTRSFAPEREHRILQVHPHDETRVFNAIAHDPAELKDYGFDFTNALESGETLASVSWATPLVLYGTTTDPMPTLSQENVTGSVATFWATGVNPGVTYAIEATAQTSSGRILSRTYTITGWAQLFVHRFVVLDQDDDLDYAIDLAVRGLLESGELLQGATWDTPAVLYGTQAPPLTIAGHSPQRSTTFAKQWFTGVAPGVTYVVRVVLTTTSGRTFVRKVTLAGGIP